MDEMNRSRMRSNTIVMNQQKAQLQRDYQAITQKEMNPLFLENQNKLVDNEFVLIEDTSEQQIKADTLKINHLLDNANELRLTAAQRTDLKIRRNRNLDFQLVNDQSTRKDSDEMKLVKNDIRTYEKLLYQSSKTDEGRQQMIFDAMSHCLQAISRCDTYLNKGKSFFFWRQGRHDLVAAAKERYQKDYETFLTLFEASDVMKKGFRENDRLIDLMNVDAVNERVTERVLQEAREAEEAERQAEQERLRLEAEEQQRQEEERLRKEAEEREALDNQAQGVNDLFTNAEKQQQEEERLRREAEERQRQEAEEHQRQEEERLRKEAEEARRAEQQRQEQQQEQQQQQQELYGTEVLDELKESEKTPEIQAIEAAITKIQTEMAKEMPAVQVMDDKEQEKKAERRARKGLAGVDALSVKMVRLFGALDQSIQKCLKKENGAGYGNNPALKTILENLREQTKVDRSQFKDKVVQYRSYIAGNAEEAVKNHTWYDAWRYVRSISYDLDEKNNGLVTKTTGAGSSMVTVIQDTKKNQTVYFRQGENAGGWNSAELVENFMESIKEEIRLSDDIKENLKEAFCKLMLQDTLDWIEGAYKGNEEDDEEQFVQAMDDLKEKDLADYRFKEKAVEEFFHHPHCPEILKETYQNADVQAQGEIEKVFKLFAKKQFQWTFSFDLAKIDPEQSLTDRNVATSRLAGYLGISSMISDSRTAVIKKDGKEIMGNVMEDSRGIEIEKVKGDWTYSDKAIGQVYTLQVFDMICGQIDRHQGNYHVIQKNGNVNSIKAIDNDMSFGKLRWKDIENGHQRLTVLTECHVRAMPIVVINQILSLDIEVLQEALGDILDSEYMDALKDRLEGVQKSIKEYANNPGAGFTISADGKTAEFTGEDQDDTLRMLKAVKEQGLSAYTRIDGRAPETYENLIKWEHFKNLDERIIEARKKWEDKQKKEQGNNQA